MSRIRQRCKKYMRITPLREHYSCKADAPRAAPPPGARTLRKPVLPAALTGSAPSPQVSTALPAGIRG